MNGQLISITIIDKSLILHITGQEGVNKKVHATTGHIWSIAMERCLLCLKWQVLREGSLINYDKSAVVLSFSEYSYAYSVRSSECR